MSAPREDRIAERRRAGRPRNGDVRVCSGCGALLEFNERYRFEGQLVPAWICDNASCRRQEVVRADGLDPVDESRQHLRTAAQVQAHAKRTMLKSRSREERALKRVAESQARVKGEAS